MCQKRKTVNQRKELRFNSTVKSQSDSVVRISPRAMQGTGTVNPKPGDAQLRLLQEEEEEEDLNAHDAPSLLSGICACIVYVMAGPDSGSNVSWPPVSRCEALSVGDGASAGWLVDANCWGRRVKV